MKTKELKITPPEGYEIDRENSSLDHIKFKPIKKRLTWKDVANSLFSSLSNNQVWYIFNHGRIKYTDNLIIDKINYDDLTNCTSEKQAQKLLAINQLMNVAKYLNAGWKPDWNSIECKWYIALGKKSNPNIYYVTHECSINVFFKTRELAEQAIEILGEDTIKLALSTDW